jgi:hypothetical protein
MGEKVAEIASCSGALKFNDPKPWWPYLMTEEEPGNISYGLEQRCPTLSPFATCGDSLFKCGDRKFFQKLHFSRKVQQIAVFTAYFSELWRMWRQEHFGWTTLDYNNLE